MKIKLKEISRKFKDADSELTIIENLSISFEEKTSFAILGRSGVGKSTLLHILGTLDKPTSGKLLYDNNDITKLNKQLKYIADSEKCEFCDISQKRVWNPQQTKDVVSFVYNIGFVHPLKNKRSLNDLVRLLFCVNDYSYTR